MKLHLIGHSIGGKIAAELVKHYCNDYDINAYLLFPTLERMAQTPSGQRLRPFLGPLRKMVVLLASVINRLPDSWVTSLLQLFLSEYNQVENKMIQSKWIIFPFLFRS